MLFLLALACTKYQPNAEDPFGGVATFTVQGGAALSELVALEWLGWSEVQGDDFAVLTMADDDFVYELMFVLEGVEGPGNYTPTRTRYRKGQQALIDVEATCTVCLVAASSGPAPYEGSFTCEGLHTEEGWAAGDEAPWSFVSGAFSGGAYTTLASRSERLGAAGLTFSVELSRAGVTVDQDDAARAMVVPWRGEETWVVFEDGQDDSLDDLTLRVLPDSTTVDLRRWTRQDLAENTAVDLHILADEPGVNAAVEGGTQSGEGTDFQLRLWDDARVGDDQVQVTIR